MVQGVALKHLQGASSSMRTHALATPWRADTCLWHVEPPVPRVRPLMGAQDERQPVRHEEGLWGEATQGSRQHRGTSSVKGGALRSLQQSKARPLAHQWGHTKAGVSNQVFGPCRPPSPGFPCVPHLCDVWAKHQAHAPRFIRHQPRRLHWVRPKHVRRHHTGSLPIWIQPPLACSTQHSQAAQLQGWPAASCATHRVSADTGNSAGIGAARSLGGDAYTGPGGRGLA